MYIKVPVQFEFIQKPGEESYCKPWLTADPYSGFIMPGTTVDLYLHKLRKQYFRNKSSNRTGCKQHTYYFDRLKGVFRFFDVEHMLNPPVLNVPLKGFF